MRTVRTGCHCINKVATEKSRLVGKVSRKVSDISGRCSEESTDRTVSTTTKLCVSASETDVNTGVVCKESSLCSWRVYIHNPVHLTTGRDDIILFSLLDCDEVLFHFPRTVLLKSYLF